MNIQRINNLYDKFIDYSDNDNMFDSRKVGWTTKHDQEVRFAALLAIGVKSNDSILDYGAGLGHLVSYLFSKDLQVNYTGIDINEKYVNIARQIFIGSTFKLGDIESETIQYDWILGSGVFSFGFDNDEIFNKIATAFALSTKGCAFNFLKPEENFIDWGFNVFNPNEMLSNLKQIYDNVYLIQGYAKDDFTIYITKEPLLYDTK